MGQSRRNKKRSAVGVAHNLSSRRHVWRLSQAKRTHEQLYDASEYVKNVHVNASYFAMIWIGVGLRIAAEKLEELAAEMLVDDIIEETKNRALNNE
jgi:hypothetical protein